MIFMSLRRTRDSFMKLVKRIASGFDRRLRCDFNVELLDGNRIAINECKVSKRGSSENHSRIIEIDRIDAVGYLTYEVDPWWYDYFVLINSNDVTYMLPVEWPHVNEVVGFLEKTLPNYNGLIGIANSTCYATKSVWPPSLAGGEFPLKETVFPSMFALRADGCHAKDVAQPVSGTGPRGRAPVMD